MNTTSQIRGDGDRWVKLGAWLVPNEIREQFRGELIADRQEMRADEVSRLRMNFETMLGLLNGIVQRAPLKREPDGDPAPQTAVSENAAGLGWWAWRLSGPIVFIGWLFSSIVLVLLGVLAFMGAFTGLAIVAATCREPATPLQVRLINGVLGGVVAILSLVFILAVPTVLFIGLASFFSVNLIASFAVQVLAFAAAGIACVLTASGWEPQEWFPRRLVALHSGASASPAPVFEPPAEELFEPMPHATETEIEAEPVVIAATPPPPPSPQPPAPPKRARPAPAPVMAFVRGPAPPAAPSTSVPATPAARPVLRRRTLVLPPPAHRAPVSPGTLP